MKKWLAALIAAVALVGVGVAVAVGGGADDPLISKSYLEGTYLTGLETTLQKTASEGTKDAYAAAVEKLDALGEADVAQAGAYEGGEAAYTPAALNRGDRLKLDFGGSAVVYEGAGKLSAGALADVTTGDGVAVGGALSAGHRYIVTSDRGAELEMTASGRLGYQGAGSVQAGTPQPLPFTDVTKTDWFYSAVEFVYGRGYYQGTDAHTFSPNVPMNRAMLATVLYRVAGSGDAASSAPFHDVPMGMWYTDGIAWASGKGIVKGVGGGAYQPEQAITREQMVAMLYNYMDLYVKGDVSARGDLSAFTDRAAISGWAEDAVAWGVAEGLLKGRDTGAFDPTGTATRAEVAVLLERFTALTEKG